VSEAVTQEYLEQAKARDHRVRTAVLAIEVEVALRSGEALRIVIDAMAREEKSAIEQLIACPPGQMGAIAAFQAQIRAYVLVRECLQDVLSHGKRAELTLREEASDMAGPWNE
jgi:hypothetical protein